MQNQSSATAEWTTIYHPTIHAEANMDAFWIVITKLATRSMYLWNSITTGLRHQRTYIRGSGRFSLNGNPDSFVNYEFISSA